MFNVLHFSDLLPSLSRSISFFSVRPRRLYIATLFTVRYLQHYIVHAERYRIILFTLSVHIHSRVGLLVYVFLRLSVCLWQRAASTESFKHSRSSSTISTVLWCCISWHSDISSSHPPLYTASRVCFVCSHVTRGCWVNLSSSSSWQTSETASRLMSTVTKFLKGVLSKEGWIAIYLTASFQLVGECTQSISHRQHLVSGLPRRLMSSEWENGE